MTGLYRTEKIRLLEAGLCAAFIGLDILLNQGWAAVPAMLAVISWQLALVGRASKYRWLPILALALGLGTNIIWLTFFNRIVISPLLCSLIGLEPQKFFDRWRR
jgi:hypothetical protein